MAIGSRLHRWWDKVRGRQGLPQAPDTETGDAQTPQPRRPAAARTVRIIEPSTPAGTLELSVEGKPTQNRNPPRSSAGFDPYANDGGSAKPRAWDDAEPR